MFTIDIYIEIYILQYEKKIVLTAHAKIKILERSIDLILCERTVSEPDFTKSDKFDSSIIHYVKKVEGKYLRVLARSEKNKKIIITAFFDRRIKKEIKND